MFFNILVIGPCDSGKTTFIENISKKLDKRYKINLINSCSRASKIADSEEANLKQRNRRRVIRKTSIGKNCF
jgi:Ni2+-binding GTPase involved in maturation of urease and hydrogenase